MSNQRPRERRETSSENKICTDVKIHMALA